MSEIPTYPDECGHRLPPDRCWECLTLELIQARDALRQAREAIREVLDSSRGGCAYDCMTDFAPIRRQLRGASSVRAVVNALGEVVGVAREDGPTRLEPEAVEAMEEFRQWKRERNKP